MRFRGEALADHDLKNIARSDVAFRFSNSFEIFGAPEIGCDPQRRGTFPVFLFWLLGGRSLFEQLARLANLAHRGIVFRAEAALTVEFAWWNIFRGTLPKEALTRLYDLVQTAAER